MFFTFSFKRIFPYCLLIFCCFAIFICNVDTIKTDSSYIKWAEFNVPYSLLKNAMEIDIKSQNTDEKIDYLKILAYISAKNGGNFKNYKKSQLTEAVNTIKENKTIDLKYYPYYLEVYNTVLGEFLGEYEAEKDGKKVIKYGLKVKHPIKGYYSDSDDFGNARSYGYKRKHLGHDFMTSIGTPVGAVESGIVETLGWNRYGGWRIGIRSFDGQRYYYYAHLRKGNPYVKGLKEGQTVTAGDTIGYVGRTGYSFKEDVNNIETPHLHFGIQLIFDESQKESNNEIWIDCYQISLLLKNPPASVVLE